MRRGPSDIGLNEILAPHHRVVVVLIKVQPMNDQSRDIDNAMLLRSLKMEKPTARASRSTILVFPPAPCGLPTREEDLADNIPWGPANAGSDWLARLNHDLNEPVSFKSTV